MAVFTSYFGKGSQGSLAEARADLWSTQTGTGTNWDTTSDRYWTLLLEQYKLYVEMADRISARRGLANTFFLTLNSAIFAAVGVFWKDRPTGSPWLLLFPAIVLVIQCMTWFWLVRSYRQLNSGKYIVVGALEERLPASPYWKAEWQVLGEGKDPGRYWPLSHVEQIVPVLFAACYLGGFLMVLLSS